MKIDTTAGKPVHKHERKKSKSKKTKKKGISQKSSDETQKPEIGTVVEEDPLVDFQAKSEKGQTDIEESTSSYSKRPSATTAHKAKVAVKPAADVNANAVPDPIPEGGLTASVIYLPTTLTVPPTATVGTTPTFTPGFSPLPPGLGFLGSTATTTSLSSTLAAVVTQTTSASTRQQVSSSHQKHVSPAAIVLIVAGIAAAFLGVFIVYRACFKPPKRKYPTPSLPILQDAFPDEQQPADEESLFGGKERPLSKGSNTLWTWTQYSQPTAQKTEPGNITGSYNQQGNFILEKQTMSTLDEKDTFPYGTNPTKNSATNVSAPQQMQTALTRAARRVSAMSMSIYPGSPQSTGGVGIALCGSGTLTGDGMPVLQRNTSKTNRRLSRSRRSMRQSVFIAEEGNNDTVTDIYDGVQTSHVTPVQPSLPMSNSYQGRAPVKAPYAPGTLLRASATVSGTSPSYKPDYSNPFEEASYVLPPVSPALKSDERRERDTRALTSALGLASPQPTLYPDDSVTLAGGRRASRLGGHGRAQSEMLSPGMEASARLGNLMLEEFTRDGAADGATKKGVRKRADDKPPRVPSPPPMPSLAQMALAHANSEEYNDYRSPTYSIYGLYEADRKSRQTGEGGY
ncbi:hypothetical protein CERSUDRAFT_93528 [Gelatoporia subvermispora B]|uniref:Transmembrane protein n=1 Tax=Ceriporiopsis subvermispora (strain B) TaxID=914234 RepID=M2QLV7_CERS8|nr:hypothetical protein CERSUDRAFT_93528 [Gelatoporia subvermispora B]